MFPSAKDFELPKSPPVQLAIVAMLAALTLAGCGGDSNAEATETSGEVEFDLEPQNGSNIAGARVVLTYVDQNRTRILVDGIDEGEPGGGGANPVELRRGTCAVPGEIVHQLPALKGASVEQTLDLSMAALYEGEYAVHVRLPGSSESRDIACGDVPDEPPS